MAIPILNHMDFQKSAEIRNVRLHNQAASGVTGAGTGQIIYDSGTVKYYNGSSWISLSASSGTMSNFVLQDGDGDDVTVSDQKVVKFIDGQGLQINWTDVSHGTGGDPYDLTFELDLSNGLSAVTPASGDSFLTLDSDGSTEQLTTVSALQSYMQSNLTFTTNTDTQLTEEQVEDFVGGMLGGTETGITVTYQDSTGDIDFVVADTTIEGDSGSTGITPGDTIKIVGGSNVTTAMSGDVLTITATDTNTQLSSEQVQDIVGAMVTGNTESGITVAYQDADGTLDFTVGTLNQDTTGTASLVVVTDSSANSNFPVVFHNESNGLLDDTTALRYNPSTGTLLAPNLVVAGTTTTVDTVTMQAANAIVFEGATADAHETTLTITDPTADRTITLQNASGTVAFTSDITGTNSGTNTGDQLVFKNVASDSGTAVADTTTDTLTIAGGTNVTTSVSGDTLTINATDTNTQLTQEQVEDFVSGLISGNEGEGIAIQYNDALGTLAIAGELASNVNKGVASFSSSDFDAVSGVVSIKTGGVSPTQLSENAITVNGSSVALGDSVTLPNTQLSTAAALIDVSAMAGNSTASFNHGLASKNLIVQMYDTTSGLIVHADVDHTDNSNISITFANTGTELVALGIGDIRVVVIDAKNGVSDSTVSYS